MNLYKLKNTDNDNIIDIVFNIEDVHKLELWLNDNLYDTRLQLKHPDSCYVSIIGYEISNINVWIEGELDAVRFYLETVDVAHI